MKGRRGSLVGVKSFVDQKERENIRRGRSRELRLLGNLRDPCRGVGLKKTVRLGVEMILNSHDIK